MTNENKKVNVFLAGPIAGIPGYMSNFCEAERIVREKYECVSVWNPADMPQGATVEWYMDKCFHKPGVFSELSRKADPCIVVALPNIGPKSGANVEIAYAKYLGVPIVQLEEIAVVGTSEEAGNDE